MTNWLTSSPSSTFPRMPVATALRPSKRAWPSHLQNQSQTRTIVPLHESSHAETKNRKFEKMPIQLLLMRTTSRAMLGPRACAPTTENFAKSGIREFRDLAMKWRVLLLQSNEQRYDNRRREYEVIGSGQETWHRLRVLASHSCIKANTFSRVLTSEAR